MSINLLDIVKDQVTGSLANGAAGFLGESEAGISKALASGIFPTLLSSVVDIGSNENGATSLLNLLKDHDGGVLDNIGGLFGGGSNAVASLMNSGSGILSTLLGNRMGGIVDVVAKMAGIKGSTTISLLKMAAPMLLGAIGKHVRGNGLGVSALMDLLAGQKQHIEAAVPSGWSPFNALSDEISDDDDSQKKVVDDDAEAVGSFASSGKRAASAAENAEKTGGSILRWLLPLLLLLMALSYFGFRTGCGQ